MRVNFLFLSLATLLTLDARAESPQTSWKAVLREFCFETNRGQAPAPAVFVASGPNYQFQLAPAQAQLVLRKVNRADLASPRDRENLIAPRGQWTRALRLQFLGADARAAIHGQTQLPGKINYLIGNDPNRWRRDVPIWSKAEVEGLYPGISVVYYGNQQQLEYDFTLAPGADASAITLRWEGMDTLAIDERGDLVLGVGGEVVRQPPPTVYQIVGGARRPIRAGYRLKDAQTVQFALGDYAPGLPLVIDPVLTYSTVLGGDRGDNALAVKVDSSGSVYVAGVTLSDAFDFTHTNGFQPLYAGGFVNGDAFVAKFDSSGSNLIYFTYLGGTNDDGAYAMAVDSSNNVYLTGFTDSPDFPVAPAGGVPGFPAGAHIAGSLDANLHVFPVDVFVTELDAGGSNLVFSTFLGGSDADVAGGIALDPSNNVYVTGYTFSSNFPTANPLVFRAPGAAPMVFNTISGSNDVFVTKFAPAGAGLVYSTYLGGTNIDEGEGIAADVNGFAYVTGFTASTNFPLTPDAIQAQFNHATNAWRVFSHRRVPNFDAFVAQIAPLGGDLVYCSYLGGTNSDGGSRIVVDAATNVYVTGYSESPDFTNTVSPRVTVPGVTNNSFINADAFLTKFSFVSSPPKLVYSALFGGQANDAGWDVAVDSAGNAYVVGITASTNFPTANTNGFIQATNRGVSDAFVTVFNPEATALVYSVYLGGSQADFGYGIAVDSLGSAWIVGRTLSTNFPTVSPFAAPLQLTNAFLARIQTVAPVETIIVDTVPPNLLVVVDGLTNTAPVTNGWVFGSPHTISAPAVQAGGPGVQYVWNSWSDAGPLTHSVSFRTEARVAASFQTQYFLDLTTTNGGAINPPSGYYNAGSNVTLTASPALGDTFLGWTGSGPGSFTGTNNPATVTMSGPLSETASFAGPLTNILTVIINGSGTVTPNYNGQTLQVGQVYAMTAQPASGFLFSSWTGGSPATNPVGAVVFTMENGLVLVANFVPNPLPAMAGSYAGLFYDTNAVLSQNSGFNRELFQDSGFFTATLTSKGSFSAKFQLAGKPYAFTGQFSAAGTFSTNILRHLLPTLTISLQLDLGDRVVTGQISDGIEVAELETVRAVYSSSQPAPESGKKYTVIIAGSAKPFAQPGGNGFGNLSVDGAGNVLLSGTLGDGMRVSQKTFVSGQGTWPLFVPLYGGGGAIFGWMTFSNTPAGELGGALTWLKPPQPHNQFYPAGFTFETEAIGSLYSVSTGSRVLSFSQGQVVLQDGNLRQSITNRISIDANNKVTSQGPNKMSLSITAPSGLFRGSTVDPFTGRALSFSGALLPQQNFGAGFFLGTNVSGSVIIGP
ncbi:conserved exported hypothetical protein [Verrucomicrobia bacterium]|nr:conserved exported hypothetical protein [Verrucomicrobiota bacterium]